MTELREELQRRRFHSLGPDAQNVLYRICRGLSVAEIGHELGIPVRRVHDLTKEAVTVMHAGKSQVAAIAAREMTWEALFGESRPHEPVPVAPLERHFLDLATEGAEHAEIAELLGLKPSDEKRLATEAYAAMGQREAAPAIARYVQLAKLELLRDGLSRQERLRADEVERQVHRHGSGLQIRLIQRRWRDGSQNLRSEHSAREAGDQLLLAAAALDWRERAVWWRILQGLDSRGIKEAVELTEKQYRTTLKSLLEHLGADSDDGLAVFTAWACPELAARAAGPRWAQTGAPPSRCGRAMCSS